MAEKPALERIDEILALLRAPTLSSGSPRVSFSPPPMDERVWWQKQLGKPIEVIEPEASTLS